MKVERIRLNIDVRNDTRSLLYNAVVDMPGKPRAEFIRSLCEQALLLRANQSNIRSTSDDSAVSDTGTFEVTDDHFADDLVGLLGKKK